MSYNRNKNVPLEERGEYVAIECLPAQPRPANHSQQQQQQQQQYDGASKQQYDSASQQQYDGASQQQVHDFVYRYYLTLAGAPHDAWRAYTVNAQYVHVDGELAADQMEVRPAVGHHQIHQNVMYQNFYECTFHLRSVNVQQTPADAAHLVLVTGDMVRGQQPSVVFIQTFLVECIKEINQYAISNSILKMYTFP